MRSCKYLQVPQSEKCGKDIIKLKNIQFFRDGKLIDHSDPHLDEKHDTVTQMSSGDVNMCPVRMGAAIVRRIRSYDGATYDTPTSAFWQLDRINHVTSKQVTAAMKDALVAIGEDALHMHKNEIGTHSIRSGAAMPMFLGGCPVYLIMMIGRWSSVAFL
jgi:hypothetical protein